MAADYYLRRSMADSSFNPQSVKRDELISAIASYRDFPEIDVTIFALTDFKLPNYNLYNKQKNMIPSFESYSPSTKSSSSSTSSTSSQGSSLYGEDSAEDDSTGSSYEGI